MKKRIVAFLLICLLAIGLSACGGGDSSSPSEEEPEYVDNIKAVASDPDAYKGKYVKFCGMVSPVDEDEDTYGLQVYLDTNYNDSVLVEVSKDIAPEPFSSDEYVIVDAKINGAYDGETVIGTDSTWALLEAISIEKTTYMEAFAPATKEISPNISSEQNGLTATIDKIEYADSETRIYLTISNNSENTISYGSYSIRLIQDGQQIEQDTTGESSYMGNYPQLSYEVAAGASTSGIVVFPAIDQTKDLQVIIPDIYSDNYEIEFTDFTIDVSAE